MKKSKMKENESKIKKALEGLEITNYRLQTSSRLGEDIFWLSIPGDKPKNNIRICFKNKDIRTYPSPSYYSYNGSQTREKMIKIMSKMVDITDLLLSKKDEIFG